MDSQKRNWTSRSLKDGCQTITVTPSLVSTEQIAIPDGLRHFILDILKKDDFSNSNRPQVLNICDSALEKVEKEFYREIKVPHFIVNKNGRVSAIQDIVLALLLNVYQKAEVKGLEGLIRDLEHRCVGDSVGDVDYRLFIKNLKNKTVSDNLQELIIVDCRYDYEFHGGHVRDAVNINDKRVIEYLFVKNRMLFQNEDFLRYFGKFKNKGINYKLAVKLITDYLKSGHKGAIVDNKPQHPLSFTKQDLASKSLYNKENYSHLLNVPIPDSNPCLMKPTASSKHIKTEPVFPKRQCSQNHPNTQKTTIIVFYCEFSSKRAPGMYNYLRSLDRKANFSNYPDLHYPHMYLLHQGYCNFVSKYQGLCEGEGGKYTRMIYYESRKVLEKENKGAPNGLKGFIGARKNLFKLSDVKTPLFEL